MARSDETCQSDLRRTRRDRSDRLISQSATRNTRTMGNDDAILVGLTAALNAQDLGAAADEGSAEGGTRQHL